MDLRFGEAKAMRGSPLESSLFISWVFSLALEVGYAAAGSLVHITTNLSPSWFIGYVLLTTINLSLALLNFKS